MCHIVFEPACHARNADSTCNECKDMVSGGYKAYIGDNLFCPFHFRSLLYLFDVRTLSENSTAGRWPQQGGGRAVASRIPDT